MFLDDPPALILYFPFSNDQSFIVSFQKFSSLIGILTEMLIDSLFSKSFVLAKDFNSCEGLFMV